MASYVQLVTLLSKLSLLNQSIVLKSLIAKDIYIYEALMFIIAKDSKKYNLYDFCPF